MRKHLIIGGLAAALLLPALAFPGAAMAQSDRYGQWGNPDQPASQISGQGSAQTDTRLQDFVDRLNKLVNEAEKARAADPVFLRDLRDLARGYNRPWRRTVLNDDFIDGDFTRDPAWTVTNGAYFIEQGWGLRNKVEQGSAAAGGGERKLTREEKALQIFGAIIKGTTGNGGAGGAATAAGPRPTAIHSPAAITNAFAVEMEISSWLPQGRLGVAVYQGGDRATGYRLSYDVGRGFSLQRYSARGAATIEAGRETIALEDKKVHRLEWVRHEDGRMVVTVDDKPVIETLDRGFRDPFSGIELSTTGGDFIVKRVTVLGTP